MFGSLSPVVHSKNWDLIRVPMTRHPDGYIVYVGDKMVRHYNDDTLPNVLKTKLAMILASPQNFIDDHAVDQLRVYQNLYAPELDEVGWRVSQSYFCLVLDRDTLTSLKHGELNGKDEDMDG
jgi:hypothetical protein